MAKDDAALKDQATEIEDILKDGKKKPLNFALMKAKEGVVLKAHHLKSAEVMLREAKAAGGMPAISCQGVLNVVGKVMELRVDVEDAPRNLPKLAKKHFANLGVLCKVVMILPGGVTVDGDAEDDEVGETEAEDPDAGLKAELAERLKALIPEVRHAAAQGMAGAERLGKAVQAAAVELGQGAHDRARGLIEAIETELRANAPDTSALRDSLVSAFNALSGKIDAFVEGAEAGIAGKARQVVAMFRTELDGDLKKAGAALAMLRKMVGGAISPSGDGEGGGGGAPVLPTGGGGTKPAPTTGGGVLSDVAAAVGGLADKVADVVAEVVEDLTTPPEEQATRNALDLLGLSRAERDKVMEDLKKDPKAVEKLKKTRMADAGVPADRQAALLKLSETSPKAFAEALKTLGAMEAGGKIDTTPAEMQKALEAMEAARKDVAARRKEMDAAAKALAASRASYGEAGGKVTTAKAVADKAAQDVADLKARVGDPSRLTPEQRLAFGTEARRLMSANETAKAELEKAIEAQKQASMDYAAASEKHTKAGETSEKADRALADAQKKSDAGAGKKALLDALSFGPLSATGRMSDEDKARFAAAFAKDPKVANGALGIAATAKDPGAVARNVGMVAGRAADGFADAEGNKLDLPEADRVKMAENALRMGGEMGDGYFQGFDEYLKSGKQLLPDPQGGLEGPLADPKAEARRLNKVSLDRTRALGAAALKDDGTVDFGTDKARAAMDHMMFHPGSLKTFTPQMTLKMDETRALFTNAATKDRAQQTIQDTRLPAETAPGRKAAVTLVSGTTGKDKGAVTDNDAKASVLSAMMTPLSQGPVGSCFSTATVRAVRETDPLRAMGEYSRLATTGQYTDQGGDVFPANTRLPEGENPLMRSWEYSVATAAAEEAASEERTKLRAGLMGGGTPPGSDLTGLKGIVGDFKWNDKNAFGRIIPGVEAKLRSAMARDLKFDYNAGPQVGGPLGGGGDGHSTDGAYEIVYKGKPLTTEADFMAAIKAIALAATGETEATDTGKAIVAHVGTPAFRDAVLNSGGSTKYTPWKLATGGFEWQTLKTLNGGNPQITGIQGDNAAGKPEGERTVEVISAMLGAQATMGGRDMSMVSTRGTKANHAFNTLPNHPSLDKIKDPGSAQKIKDTLVDPGKAMALKKLPAEQAAKVFEDQIRAAMEGKPDGERDLLVAALKNRPTVEMTPAEIKAKIATELAAWRDVAAERRLDAALHEANKEQVAKGLPPFGPDIKAANMQSFKDMVENEIKGEADVALMKELQPPEIVIADSNWGGPENQVFFVAAPNPVTGELTMWKKTMPGATMVPLGKNWADADWYKVQ